MNAEERYFWDLTGYLIVRGAENIPIRVGDLELPGSSPHGQPLPLVRPWLPSGALP